MSYVIPVRIPMLFGKALSQFYTGYLQRSFAQWGSNSIIEFSAKHLQGQRFIFVGDFTSIGKNAQLTAWETFQNQKLTPKITIGNYCCLRDGIHITSVVGVTIGNNVLTGTNVYISDNSHGKTTLDDMRIRPELRQLTTKGAVIIEDNVWIGNNVCILTGVTIGKGSIIGANAVVTKDVPPFSIAAGIPARIINKQNI